MKKSLIFRPVSFRHALAGWYYLFRTQPNAWVHLAATFAVITISLVLGLDSLKIAVLVATIAIVWLAETINTSIETLVDLTCPQQHPLAKIVKDVSAGAVLFAASFSVVIGCILLVPPLLSLF
ncbi:MAG TPA: diacylglycerol kinase family protein [Anaerolineaceae bacterium]